MSPRREPCNIFRASQAGEAGTTQAGPSAEDRPFSFPRLHRTLDFLAGVVLAIAAGAALAGLAIGLTLALSKMLS